jgi:hypothetical protein
MALSNTSHTFPNLHTKNNTALESTTNKYLQITAPDTSREVDDTNELNGDDGDNEYEMYDLESLSLNYTDIKCTQNGLQCADRTTIMDCSEDLREPLFIMSCSSLLYSNDGENASGRCDDKTRSCILSSQNMTLLLSINTVMNEDIKVCESYSGLRCVNNQTLVACSGEGKGTHYTVSCDGVAITNAGSSLQGQCYKNSCIFVTVHQTNNSDIQVDQSENYASYHLPPPNANSSTSEPLYSNTDFRDVHEEPEISIHQVEVFGLYDEYDTLKYRLSKAGQEYFVKNRNISKLHTRKSSCGGDTTLATNTAEKNLTNSSR